ncbi:MAG: COX15/CtaA family protein [Anaerolineae bacterium]|nr:COX15/CtaA family protein [Anaerolineae bacterium]
MQSLNRFAKYAWAVLAYNVLVILWGAFVRATGSGAGCGAHWPMCNGEVIPRSPQMNTLIEFSHRLSSGLALLLVAGLLVWAFRAYPPRHIIRRGAVYSAVFILLEAVIGAGLVLLELVAHNASVTRAVSISLHLVNTFLLLAALTWTAWWASGGRPLSLTGRRPLGLMLLVGMLGAMAIGASGGIVALGDTLFPPETLAAGLSRDLDPTAHFLERLRIYHPIIAVLVGAGLFLLATYIQRQIPSLDVQRAVLAVRGLVIVQWVAGAANVALLAPVWMQLLHLLLADLLWIALVLLAAFALAAQPVPEPLAPRRAIGVAPNRVRSS